jgi:hypothetical protein
MSSLAHDVDALMMNMLHMLVHSPKATRAAVVPDETVRDSVPPQGPMELVLKNLQRLALLQEGEDGAADSRNIALGSKEAAAASTPHYAPGMADDVDAGRPPSHAMHARSSNAFNSHRVSSTRPTAAVASSGSSTAPSSPARAGRATHDTTLLSTSNGTGTFSSEEEGDGSPFSSSVGGGGGNGVVGRWHATALIRELRRVEERTATLLNQQAQQHAADTLALREQVEQQQQLIFSLQQDKFDLQQEMFATNEKRASATDVLRHASAQLSELERAQQDELDVWRRQVRDLRAQLHRVRFEKNKLDSELQQLSQQFALVSGELARSKARVCVLRDHASTIAVRSKQKDEELRDVAVFVKETLLPFTQQTDKLTRKGR